MKPFAKKFYQSTSWINTRDAYSSSKNYLCEICGRPSEIVHHKIWLNPSNINDPNVTLNWDNLQLVCRECHHKIHQGTSPTPLGIEFDEFGNVIENKKVI